MTYPFVGEIKMTKVIKDGEEVIEWEQVDMSTEVLRISKEGIWANPNVPVDEAAKLVLDALDSQIKVLVQRAVEAEREACAKALDAMAEKDKLSNYYQVAALSIRERGAP